LYMLWKESLNSGIQQFQHHNENPGPDFGQAPKCGRV
jgi:hypothetical protein